MNTYKWIDKNCESLKGKTVAITGSTGGIGEWLCDYLLYLGASLLLLDRNPQKQQALHQKLISKYPFAEITLFTLDLESEASVFSACEKLKELPIDIFLHNAGAYSIPRKICKSGFDNVFQINFLSPYYIINEFLQMLRGRGGKVVVVGSIAHNYSKSDPENPDFKNIKAASLVYGNAKRYLMFSLYELFKNEDKASLSVAHPGITFTNITAHYQKLIFAIIKHPMKIIFMPPKVAALSILKACFKDCGYKEWLGPAIFDIWGMPKAKKLKTVSDLESQQIFKTASKALLKYSGLSPQ